MERHHWRQSSLTPIDDANAVLPNRWQRRMNREMPAFYDDPEVKALLLARLKTYAEAGQILNAEGVWKDGRGSPAGCVVEATGLALWPERTGMPKVFGAMLDGVAKYLGSPQRAGRFTLEWFDAVAVGQDMGVLAHALIGWLLTDGRYGMLHLSADEQVLAIVRRVAELHRRGEAGQEPTPTEWSMARDAAMAAADAHEPGTEKLMMSMVEACAWNPATAATVISDTLQAWIRLGTARDGPARAEKIQRAVDALVAEREAEAEKAGLPKPAPDMKRVGMIFMNGMMAAIQADHEQFAKVVVDLTKRSGARSRDAPSEATGGIRSESEVSS
jgi:hypothetical protein